MPTLKELEVYGRISPQQQKNLARAIAEIRAIVNTDQFLTKDRGTRETDTIAHIRNRLGGESLTPIEINQLVNFAIGPPTFRQTTGRDLYVPAREGVKAIGGSITGIPAGGRVTPLGMATSGLTSSALHGAAEVAKPLVSDEPRDPLDVTAKYMASEFILGGLSEGAMAGAGRAIRRGEARFLTNPSNPNPVGALAHEQAMIDIMGRGSDIMGTAGTRSASMPTIGMLEQMRERGWLANQIEGIAFGSLGGNLVLRGKLGRDRRAMQAAGVEMARQLGAKDDVLAAIAGIRGLVQESQEAAVAMRRALYNEAYTASGELRGDVSPLINMIQARSSQGNIADVLKLVRQRLPGNNNAATVLSGGFRPLDPSDAPGMSVRIPTNARMVTMSPNQFIPQSVRASDIAHGNFVGIGRPFGPQGPEMALVDVMVPGPAPNQAIRIAVEPGAVEARTNIASLRDLRELRTVLNRLGGKGRKTPEEQNATNTARWLSGIVSDAADSMMELVPSQNRNRVRQMFEVADKFAAEDFRVMRNGFVLGAMDAILKNPEDATKLLMEQRTPTTLRALREAAIRMPTVDIRDFTRAGRPGSTYRSNILRAQSLIRRENKRLNMWDDVLQPELTLDLLKKATVSGSAERLGFEASAGRPIRQAVDLMEAPKFDGAKLVNLIEDMSPAKQAIVFGKKENAERWQRLGQAMVDFEKMLDVDMTARFFSIIKQYGALTHLSMIAMGGAAGTAIGGGLLGVGAATGALFAPPLIAVYMANPRTAERLIYGFQNPKKHRGFSILGHLMSQSLQLVVIENERRARTQTADPEEREKANPQTRPIRDRIQNLPLQSIP